MYDFYDSLLELDQHESSFNLPLSEFYLGDSNVRLNEAEYHELDKYFENKWGIDPLKPCIYLKDNNYIGSSFNILTRYDASILDTISILQSFENGCSKEELLKREQYYIDLFAKEGYNLRNKNKAYDENNNSSK